MPLTEEQVEREQVEQVFSLTGGELSDRPWPVVYASTLSDGTEHTTKDGRSWAAYQSDFRYWYEGAPSYADDEFSRDERSGNSGERNIRTAVTCALFGMPPAELWDVHGCRWERVAFYTSSGETECFGKDMEREGEECAAVRPCPYCEAQEGEEHGCIYLGDGWGEAVYVQATPRVEFEIIDHGCDGESYFPGCGVSFTTYTDCVTGIGDSAREAGEDALEQACTADLSDELIGFHELESAVGELSSEDDAIITDEDGGEPNPEWHHYVSIRWRIVRH